MTQDRTAARVLEIARAEIGTAESPANSNNVKYNTWFWGKSVSGSKYPWCMAFVQWCFDRAGMRLPCVTASCSALENWFKRNKPDKVVKTPRPGDIVIYTFGHTGIVESAGSGYITAIEGNTSPGNAGSQSNGGMVCRRTRASYTVKAYLRPDYMSEKGSASMLDNIPSKAHEKGVNWAVQNGILNGSQQGDLMLGQPLTRQQFCTMLYNYHQKFGKEC